MQIRLILFFSLYFCLYEGFAQQTPSEIKYKAWDIHALRYYPFTQPADSFMSQVIEKISVPIEQAVFRYEKTAVDLAMNKQYLADEINRSTASQNLIYKYILLPYNAWLSYARPVRENSSYLNLTLFLSEHCSKENCQAGLSDKTPVTLVEPENTRLALQEWLGDVELRKERNEVLFFTVQSPLAKGAEKIYRYFFSSRTEIEGIPVYEIAFFSKKLKEKAFEGYLYISVNDLSPVKSVLTLNPFIKIKPAKSALFIQTPSKKETILFGGNDITTAFIIEQVRFREKQSTDSIPSDYMSPAQKEISGLVEEARKTRSFSNLQNGLSLLLFDRIGIFRNNFDLGPITQMISFNYPEGVRLRIGGSTTQKISKQVSLGGYLAYGTKDKQSKYRGDIVWFSHTSDRIQMTYVNDLNIPGYDCLEDKRDRIFYSLYPMRTTNLSLQKIGRFSYESEKFRPFSFQLNTKYLYDRPIGTVKYETVNKEGIKTIRAITTSEIGISFLFAPNEKFIRVKGQRIVLHSPEFDFRLNHRIGVKGILGSDFNYQITDVSLFKSFNLPLNTGSLNVRFTGGKVWNSVPFPLLFIPKGNQSYVYETNNYNLMRFYEFTTDRFVAGNAELQLNWSPVKLFLPKNTIKTCGGIKSIYGPLSEKNDPHLHPELFVFNNGVESLGKRPYAEINLGLSGILNYFRIDYVYRLTYRDNYRNKGSLFVSTVLNL